MMLTSSEMRSGRYAIAAVCRMLRQNLWSSGVKLSMFLFSLASNNSYNDGTFFGSPSRMLEAFQGIPEDFKTPHAKVTHRKLQGINF